MARLRTALPQPVSQPAVPTGAFAAPRFAAAPGPFTIQPKLQIGAPGDRHEQEADRVASQVVNLLHAPAVTQPGPPAIQRQEAGEPEDGEELEARDEERIQTKEISSLPRPSGDLLQGCDACCGTCGSPEFEATLQRARDTGGEPFPQSVRQPLERAFGADFSGVTIHRDRQSDQLNHAIHSRAFTTGQDLFFRQGEYNPASRGGQELLAHELTHVVQQSGGETGSLVQRACTRAECGGDPEDDPAPAQKRKNQPKPPEEEEKDEADLVAVKKVKVMAPAQEAQGGAARLPVMIATKLENGHSSAPDLQRQPVTDGGTGAATHRSHSGRTGDAGALFLNVAAVPNTPGVDLVQRAGVVTGALNTGAAFPTALAGAPPVVKPAYGAVTGLNTATSMTVQGLHQQALGTGVGGKRPTFWKQFQELAGNPFCQGHFLSQKLSGRGEHRNLAPFTRSLNGLHSTQVEQKIINWTRAAGQNEWADYAVTGNYLGNPKIAKWARKKYDAKPPGTRWTKADKLPGAGGPFATLAAADAAAHVWIGNYVTLAFPTSIDCDVNFIKKTVAGNYAATAKQNVNITNDF